MSAELKPNERSIAQFFFEVGYAACFAEVMIRNDLKPPFELTDEHIEAGFPRSIEAHEDREEMDRYLAMAATRAPEPLLAEVREVLKPFSEWADWFDSCEQHSKGCPDGALAGEAVEITVGDLRKARALLTRLDAARE